MFGWSTTTRYRYLRYANTESAVVVTMWTETFRKYLRKTKKFRVKQFEPIYKEASSDRKKVENLVAVPFTLPSKNRGNRINFLPLSDPL